MWYKLIESHTRHGKHSIAVENLLVQIYIQRLNLIDLSKVCLKIDFDTFGVNSILGLLTCWNGYTQMIAGKKFQY